MMDLLRVLSLLLVALAMAFALAHAAELPGKLRLDRSTYLAVQRMDHPGFTIGGISEPAATLALGALLAATPRSAGVGWIGGALAAVIGMQAVYWLVTHPVNRFWLAGQDLPGASRRFFGAGGGAPGGDEAEDWLRLRNRWEGSHVVRAGLAVAGFVSLAIGVATGS